MDLKENLQEFIEMLESDLKITQKVGGIYDERKGCLASHNDILKGIIDDLKEMIEE